MDLREPSCVRIPTEALGVNWIQLDYSQMAKLQFILTDIEKRETLWMMPRSGKDVRVKKKSGTSLSCVPSQKQAPALKAIWGRELFVLCLYCSTLTRRNIHRKKPVN